jgi:hypothetical protein
MNLAGAEQIEQCVEVLAEPLRVAGTSTDSEGRSASADRKSLMTVAEPLNAVRAYAPAGRS